MIRLALDIPLFQSFSVFEMVPKKFSYTTSIRCYSGNDYSDSSVNQASTGTNINRNKTLSRRNRRLFRRNRELSRRN